MLVARFLVARRPWAFGYTVSMKTVKWEYLTCTVKRNEAEIIKSIEEMEDKGFSALVSYEPEGFAWAGQLTILFRKPA
jgi:hypothetical protein